MYSIIRFFFYSSYRFLFQEVDDETPNSTSPSTDFVPYCTGTTYQAKQIRILFQPDENNILRVFWASFQAGIQKFCSIMQYTFSCFSEFFVQCKTSALSTSPCFVTFRHFSATVFLFVRTSKSVLIL